VTRTASRLVPALMVAGGITWGIAAQAQATQAPSAQTPGTQRPGASSGQASAGTGVFLERIQALVDGALAKGGDSGDSLKKAGKVEVDRATLDEIRAELAQLRMMLANSDK